MSNEPVSQRLSDAERDEAVGLLREHFESGRLDEAEFTERLERALAAKVASDLEPQFADLPEPHPSVLTGGSPWPPAAPLPYTLDTRADAGVPATAGGTDWVGVARGVIWPVALILAMFTGHWGMFIVAAIIGSIVLKQVARNRRTPPPYLDHRPPPVLGR